MKKIAILLSLIISVSAQTTIDSLKASKVNRNILEVSQSTLDTLQSHGMKFYINQYYNLSDWDNDGLKDLVITVGQVETINTYASLFKQKKVNGTVKFVEDPSYLMNIQGRPHDWSTSVGDVNGDNLLDIVFATENYHGPDGQQPYYFEERKMWTTDKLFINNGNGFNRFELDTTKHNRNGIQEYWHHSGVTLLDWDGDGKLEILLSSGGAKNNGYEPIRTGPNPVFDKLFSSYEIDANNNITLEYAFDWNLENDWIVTYTQKISIINDKLYLAVGEDKGWDTVNSIFVDEALIDGQQVIWHSDSEVLIFDYKQSFGEKSLEKRITLDSKNRGGGMVYQDGFHPADIDNDGKLEYITAYWYESQLKQVPFIKIYDDDGTDITDTWLGDKYMDTSKKHGGGGVNVVDINNDGYIDIIPRDGWNYFRDSHSPNMGDFTDKTRGTFGIFLNDGTKFNQYNIDFSHLDIDDKSATYLRSGSRLYTKEPVDFDNDGLYEFLIRFDRGDGNANIDIVTVDYKNNIEDLSDISIKEDSIKVIKLSAADLKGGTISYSAKSAENNVTATMSNDTLTLTPALNWHGTAQITAYASGSSWKDSTTFTLTITAVNDAPVITAVSNYSTDEETEKAIKLSGSDIDGDALTYTASSDTSGVVVTVSTDTLKLTPALNYTGTSVITVIVSDNALADTSKFDFKVINVNDAPVIAAVANDTTSEDSDGKALKLSASDIDGDALTYSGIADTSAITVTSSNDTLKLIPQANWNGSSVITAIASDGIASDSTTFTLTVTSVNDAPSLLDTTFNEDTSISIVYTIQSGVTLGAKADTSAIKFSMSNNNLSITPDADYFGSSVVTLTAYEGAVALDSTFFTVSVKQIQDAPYAFDWLSTASDTINISQSNLADTYELKWSESKDVDGETIDYLLYVKIGVLEPEEIYDTTSTSVPITYQEFLENVFEPFPMLPRVTVKFSVSATDGIDTVKITGDNRVLFVNRYEYLSTESEGIPTEFALHENYPNPFNPTTTLRFDLPEVSDITLTIYNMLGQKVRTFNYQNTSAGYHSVTWDATNDFGEQVGAGVYLYQLRAKQFVKTRKMVLLK